MFLTSPPGHHLRPFQVERENVNMFCFSKLWQSQCVSAAAKALEEHQFCVPGAGTSAVAASFEGRRNLTDVQETSQWLGGEEIPKLILGDLLNCFLAGCFVAGSFFLVMSFLFFLVLYFCF